MTINDETYLYLDEMLLQIEGIVSALNVHIENSGFDLEKYHYRIFDNFMNKVREKAIKVIEQITDSYREVQENCMEMTVVIGASDELQKELQYHLDNIYDNLQILIIQSQNIREFKSDTGNVVIPDLASKAYDVFLGYRGILEKYELSCPNEADVIADLCYVFFGEVKNAYYRLFEEYDRLLKELGDEIEQRLVKEKAEYLIEEAELINTRIAMKKIAKKSVDIGKVTLGMVIGEKGTKDLVKTGLGVMATISKEAGIIEKRNEKWKGSGTEKFLKICESANEAVEELGICGLEDIASIRGMVKYSSVMSYLKKANIKEDITKEKAKLLADTVDLTADLLTGNSIRILLKDIPKTAKDILGLADAIIKAEQIEEQPTKLVRTMLKGMGKLKKEYEMDVKEQESRKLRGFPIKKSKSPPIIIVKKTILGISNVFIDEYLTKGENKDASFKRFL